MSQPTKTFQVAVVGGGAVCGLAAAAALQKAGISVDVFEAAVCFLCMSEQRELMLYLKAAFGEVGASIGLGTRVLSLFIAFAPRTLKRTRRA